jgi:hypothetical protein
MIGAKFWWERERSSHQQGSEADTRIFVVDELRDAIFEWFIVGDVSVGHHDGLLDNSRIGVVAELQQHIFVDNIQAFE